MKKVLLLVCILAYGYSYAQDLYVSINQKGKVGYVDAQGAEVIGYQYETGRPFRNGFAIVSKSGKYGIIDTAGNDVLPLKYDQISVWNDKLYLIKSGKTVGLASKDGQIVLPAKYSMVSPPNCYGKAVIGVGGKAAVSDKKTYMNQAKYGLINNNGEILIEPKYKGLYEFTYPGSDDKRFNEGMRLRFNYHFITDTLETDCSYLGYSNNGDAVYDAGLMDGEGNALILPKAYTWIMMPKSDMVRYYIADKKNTLCGYYDLKNKTSFQVADFNWAFSEMTFWSHGDFIGDIAPVNGSSWSFINKEGKTLRSGYSQLKHSQTTGLWAAKKEDGLWDVFDDANKDISSLEGYSVINFPTHVGDKEIYTVKKDNHYGAIDRNGNVIIPFIYEQLNPNTYDFIAAKNNGKWGFLSTDNQVLIPIEYEEGIMPIVRGAQDFWMKKSDRLYYHYNLRTHKEGETGYKAVVNYENGLAYVVPKDMKVKNTLLNRAQMYAPNASKDSINNVDASQHAESFVNIVDTADVVVFDLPVSTIYMDGIRKEIEKKDSRKLSEADKKRLLLNATIANRSYDLKNTIGEEEWDY